MKYLEKYYEWMETGKVPERTTKHTTGGLCSFFGRKKMSLFEPTEEDDEQYNTHAYWGSDVSCYDDTPYSESKYYDFGPTRQNIVLLLAAMNGEL